MAAPVYVPLASAEDMREGPFRYALTGASPAFVESTMRRASRHIETLCARRLAPFTGLLQTERAEGVAQDNPGTGGLPLSLTATLALSQARAYGTASALVRDLWLDEHAPAYPDLWTYAGVAVTVLPPFGGGGQAVTPLEGPAPDTGHLRLPYGTYCPVGSTVRIVYSGGYTVGVPEDLVQAALMQATKFFILGIAPERRGDLGTKDLSEAIAEAIEPYRRSNSRKA